MPHLQTRNRDPVPVEAKRFVVAAVSPELVVPKIDPPEVADLSKREVPEPEEAPKMDLPSSGFSPKALPKIDAPVPLPEAAPNKEVPEEAPKRGGEEPPEASPNLG